MADSEIKKEIRNEEWNIEYTRQNFLSNIIYYSKKVPPRFDGAMLWINRENVTTEEISLVAFDYISDLLDNDSGKSFWWGNEDERDNIPLDERPSAFLYDVMEFYLRNNLDPNFKTKRESLMHHLCKVVNGYLAADTLKLLLENGGDTNVLSGTKTLFETIDSYLHQKINSFDLAYVESPGFQSVVHCWFVLLGFGGHSKNSDTLPLTRLYKDGDTLFQLEKLKNHRNYAINFGKSFTQGNSHCCRIYDIRSGKDVAWI